MLNYLDTLTAGSKIAIYDDRTSDYTIAEVDEVSETQVYVKNSWYYAHIAFKKSDGKSIDKTNQWITLCSVTEAEQLKAKAAKAKVAQEVTKELAEARYKAECNERKAKLIAVLNDKDVTIDSDKHLEQLLEVLIGF